MIHIISTVYLDYSKMISIFRDLHDAYNILSYKEGKPILTIITQYLRIA